MSAEPCDFLEWDSEFFGVRIARVRFDRLDAGRQAEVEAWCHSRRIDCLYFLASPDHPDGFQLAEECGYRLMDVRMTYVLELGEGAATDPGDESTPVRSACAEDTDRLKAIARENHRDSRFYADARFPRERCADLYATWMTRSLDGFADEMLVAERAGAVEGYITLHHHPAAPEGRIGLFGVSRACQGHGVGGRLLAASLVRFAGRGARRVTVVTQGRNVRAQRFYQRCGFVIAEMGLWFHKWFR